MELHEDEKAFQKVVSSNTRDGIHLRRGLSVEEYTALCRRAWDNCQATLDFPFKVLIDPLRPIENLIADGAHEYVHWRAGDAIEASREPSTEIYCKAIGPARPDFSTGPDLDAPASAEELDEYAESRRYIVAVFDVLGFSTLLSNKGLSEIMSLYSKLISESVTKEAVLSLNFVRLSNTQHSSILGSAPIRHAHFSDTILLWTPLVQHFIAPFMARCADLICEALKMGIPLRGALGVGLAVMHSRSGTFVGPPLVEAARLEQAQDWLGASLGLSMLATDVSQEFDPNLVIPYQVPLKKGSNQITSGLALDWPRRFRTRYGIPPADAIRAIDTSSKYHMYYANAAAFAEFSGGPLFRSEGLQMPNLGELADAAIAARNTKTSLSQYHQYMLKDLARAGDVGAFVATFVKSVSEGKEPPAIQKDLPSGMKKYLRELSLASQGNAKFFQLSECAVDAICARLCGTPLSKKTNDLLDELDIHYKDTKAIAVFFRELAAGHDVAIPRGLDKRKHSFLRQALAWVNRGEVPQGLLMQVAEDCLKVRLGKTELSAHSLRILAALEATGRHWISVTSFLRAIAAGEEPSVPPEVPDSVESNLVRLSWTSKLARVQQPRVLEIFSIGIGDPATGIDLFSMVRLLVGLRDQGAELPEEVEQAIQRFELGASERAVVGQRLRVVITKADPSPEPENLPIAIKLVLVQINAVAAGKPIPIDPFLVGMAAIRARHSKSNIGDCMLFSLIAMANADEEMRQLAEYLWIIANGGPPAPAPILKNAQLVETAEEVRCLADKEVGGFRMMVMPRTEQPDDKIGPE